MDLTEYESRRKSQNREAQRRYRHRQKKRVSQSKPTGDAVISPPFEEWACPAVAKESMTFSDTGFFDSSCRSAAPGFEDVLVNCSNDDPYDVVADSFMSTADVYISVPASDSHSSPGATSGSDGHMCSCCGGSSNRRSESQPLSKTHDKIYNKAARMTDDLTQLYDFGVEMQLICPDEELRGSLNSMKSKFRRSIHRAANTPSHD